MAAINGKWVLKSSQNMEALMKACGVSAEIISAALPKIDNVGGMVEEYIIDSSANSGRRNIYQSGALTREGKNFQFGQEITDATLDGRQVTARFDLQSDSKILRTERGDGYNATSTLEAAGNNLTMTYTCGSVTAVRKYEKQ